MRIKTCFINHEIVLSTTPRNKAKATTTINTTIAAPTNSWKVGHSTLESSTLTSCINFEISIYPPGHLSPQTTLYFTNTLYLFLAGQEGFEPPTIRFGVCRSAVRATGLHYYLVSLWAPCFLQCGQNFLSFNEPAVLDLFTTWV